MKLVFTSYSSSPEFSQPDLWLERINGYTGILEHLNKTNTVFGIERIDYEGEYEYKGVRYFFTRLNRKVARFPFKLHKQIKSLEPDVVFVNGFIFPLQVLQLRWQLGKKVKIIVLHRAERPFSGIKRYLQKMADKCVSHYCFTSAEFGDEWIRKGIIKERSKIREIIQASSVFAIVDRVVAMRSISVTGVPVFLWVGRLDTNKDPITIVKAFIQFLTSQPRARLYMIYQSCELLDDVNELLRDDEIAKQAIVLVGRVDHARMQLWYNSADFIISGSYYEGSGVAVSEAMSCGCIPIVTNIASFRRMTGPGKCGLLFEPGNCGQLTRLLLHTGNLDLANEREKVVRQFEEELSFAAIAGKINNLISTFKPVSS